MARQLLHASGAASYCYELLLRHPLAVEVAETESEATYQQLFRSLKTRGLSGVELIVSDDHEGLKAAISRHFQGASHQRCQVHYARNLLGLVEAVKGGNLVGLPLTISKGDVIQLYHRRSSPSFSSASPRRA
jgi:hypothetical protein